MYDAIVAGIKMTRCYIVNAPIMFLFVYASKTCFILTMFEQLYKCVHTYLNRSQLAKLNEKRLFLSCCCHEIYRVDAVGLKNYNYT